MPTGTWFDVADELGRPLWDDPVVGEDLPVPVIASTLRLSPASVQLSLSHPTPGIQLKIWRRVDPEGAWELDQTLPVGIMTALVEGLAIAAYTQLSATAVLSGFDESEHSPTVEVGRGPIIDLIHADDRLMPTEFPLTITGTANPNQSMNMGIGAINKAFVAGVTGTWSVTFSFAEVGTGLKSANAAAEVNGTFLNTNRVFIVGPQPPAILSIPAGTSPVMIVGTAQANALIKLYVDGILKSSSIQADASGNWSFSTALIAGGHSAQATQTVLGIESALSAQVSFTINQSGGGEPPPGPFPPAPEPPPATEVAGPALAVVGSASPIDQGDSRQYTVESEDGLIDDDFVVESSSPGTIRAEVVGAGTFELTVIGGGDEQVTINVRKEGYAPTSLVLRIIPSFAVLGAIVVSGDRQLLDSFRRRR